MAKNLRKVLEMAAEKRKINKISLNMHKIGPHIFVNFVANITQILKRKLPPDSSLKGNHDNINILWVS